MECNRLFRKNSVKESHLFLILDGAMQDERTKTGEEELFEGLEGDEVLKIPVMEVTFHVLKVGLIEFCEGNSSKKLAIQNKTDY